MRRRLVLTISGAVAGAVLVVGLGTLLLTGLDARRRAESTLLTQVEELVSVVEETPDVRLGPLTGRLQPALDIDSLAVVPLASGAVSLSPNVVDRLENGESVSGRIGGRVFAAVPLQPLAGTDANRALVGVDSVDTGLGAAGRWFLLAGALTVLAGGLAAMRLGRSMAGPIGEVESATHRIARGDLAVRVPEPAGDDELSRLVRSINEMAESLHRSRGLEREFLLSISHDLRTPLTAIAGWAEALADGRAPDPERAGATILASAHRLDRLVRDLLDLARLRARSFTLNSTAVDVVETVSETAEGLRPALAEAGVATAIELPDIPVMMRGDPGRLAQLAANLIENAGRHATTEMTVRVTTGPGKVILEVSDDGPGIPESQRDEVFEPHSSMVRPAARSIEGTGMGLAIVKELVVAMNGKISVGEGPGGGARFVATFPTIEEPDRYIGRQRL